MKMIAGLVVCAAIAYAADEKDNGAARRAKATDELTVVEDNHRLRDLADKLRDTKKAMRVVYSARLCQLADQRREVIKSRRDTKQRPSELRGELEQLDNSKAVVLEKMANEELGKPLPCGDKAVKGILFCVDGGDSASCQSDELMAMKYILTNM